MTSFTVLRNITSIALAACAIGVSNGSAETYTLTDLGVLPGQKINVSTPAAINNQGQVAGTSGASAFRYNSANTTPMEDVGGDPKNSITRGFGINGSAQVVGDSTFKGGKSHAALFSDGSARDLGTLENGGAYSRANGINASGQVVGFTSEQPDLDGRAFVVSTSALGSIYPNDMLDLGTLGGIYAQAWGINDSGFVTGNSQVDNNSTHAFIWDVASGMLDLGTLGADFSYGTSINANNHIAGYSTINYADDRIHAFLHDGQRMIDLGSLGGASMESDRSFALGINAADQVVGYSYLPNQGPISTDGAQQVAFLYRQGLMLNLNDLIGSASSEFLLYSATGINDKGRIVAIAFVKSAGAFHAVLLTPTRPIDIDPVSRTQPAKR